jgi:hypothetical protein
MIFYFNQKGLFICTSQLAPRSCYGQIKQGEALELAAPHLWTCNHHEHATNTRWNGIISNKCKSSRSRNHKSNHNTAATFSTHCSMLGRRGRPPDAAIFSSALCCQIPRSQSVISVHNVKTSTLLTSSMASQSRYTSPLQLEVIVRWFYMLQDGTTLV